MDLSRLDQLGELHQEAAASLFRACQSELFPCDGLALSVLERSLHLIKGFRVICEADGYSCAFALHRMQLDNLLRFNGIIQTKSAHDTAQRVIHGARLSTLKDRSGAAMTDKHLLSLLSKANPWIQQSYELASGYIHLSDQHFWHFFSRAPLDASGTRQFTIGEDESYISHDHREKLLAGFTTLSNAVPALIEVWAQTRLVHGSNLELKQRFEHAA